MIIWLASYPKSGNTLIRSMLTAYLFSQDGNFNFDLLNNIKQFPDNAVFTKLGIDISDEKEVVKNYIFAQEEINKRDGKSVRFLKTHSGLNNINGYSFTNYKNTLGAIYIARDPRKVLKSYANHSEITFEEAQKRILNFGIVGGKSDPINQTVIHSGSWASNYNSWKEFKKKNKYLLVKYEDLITDKEKTFQQILKFIHKLKNIDFVLDKKKFNNIIQSTEFQKVQKLEDTKGFEESVIDKNTGKKIKFFRSGAKTNWKKSLDPILQNKIQKAFAKEMEELGYL